MFSVLLSLASSQRRFHRRHHRHHSVNSATEGSFVSDQITVSYSNCVNVVISRASEILTKAPQLKNINEQLQTDLMIKAEDFFANPSTLKSKYSKSYYTQQQTKTVLKDPSKPLLGFPDPRVADYFLKYLYYVDGWYAELIPGDKKLTIRACTMQTSSDQDSQKGKLVNKINQIFNTLKSPSTQEQKQTYNKIFQA